MREKVTTGWLADKSERLTTDIRHHWLRHLVQLGIAVAIVWPAVTFVQSISNDFVRAQRDRFGDELEQTKRQLQESRKRSEQLESKLATLTKEQQKHVQGSPLHPKTAVADSPRLAPEPRSLAPGLIGIPQSAERSIPSVRPEAPSPSCDEMRAHLNALKAIANVGEGLDAKPLRSSISVEASGSAKVHLSALSRLYGGNADLLAFERSVSFTTSFQEMARIYEFAHGLLPTQCRQYAAVDVMAENKRRCEVIARLQLSLKTLSNATEHETLLTPKDHLVQAYNALLREARRELRDDALILGMKDAALHYWHAETQKYLLFEIEILSSRLASIALNCPAS